MSDTAFIEDVLEVQNLEMALARTANGAAGRRSILDYITKPLKSGRDVEAICQAFWMECSKAGKAFYYNIPVRGGNPMIGPSVDMTRAAIRYWRDCGIEVVLVSENDRDYLFEATFVDRNFNIAMREQLMMPKNWSIRKGDEASQRKDVFLHGKSRCERNCVEHSMPEDMMRIGVEKAMAGAHKQIEDEIKVKGGKQAYIKGMIAELGKLGVEARLILMKYSVADQAKLSVDNLIQMRQDMMNLRRGDFQPEELYVDKQKIEAEDKEIAEKKGKLREMAAKLAKTKSESRLRFEEHWRSEKPEDRFAWLKLNTKDRHLLEGFGKYSPDEQINAMADVLDWGVDRDLKGKPVKKKEAPESDAPAEKAADQKKAEPAPAASAASGKEKFKVNAKPDGAADIDAAMKYVQKNFPGYMTKVKAAMQKYGVGVQTTAKIAAGDVAKLYADMVAIIPENFRG